MTRTPTRRAARECPSLQMKIRLAEDEEKGASVVTGSI